MSIYDGALINVRMLLAAITNCLPFLRRGQKQAPMLSQVQVDVKDGHLIFTSTDRFGIVKSKVSYTGDDIPGARFYLSLDELTALKALKTSRITYKNGQLHVEEMGLSFGSAEPFTGQYPNIDSLWEDQLKKFPVEGENTAGSHVSIDYIKHIKKTQLFPRAPRGAWIFVTEDKTTCGILMPKQPKKGIAAELYEAGF